MISKLNSLASLLQKHDPSEIIVICWFAVQETFFIINIFLSLSFLFLNVTFDWYYIIYFIILFQKLDIIQKF